MSGFLFALLATWFWSLVNIIDKYLVEKYCKESGVGALIVLSSLFTVFLVPLAYFFANSTIWISEASILILIFSGTLTVGWISLYLFALQEEEVSVVMPLFQITPLFALIFGFLFLNEILTGWQLIAGAVILMGSAVLSIERTTGKIKWKLVLYLTASSAIIALMNTTFKFVAIDESFWVSIFWHSVGSSSTGLLLYLTYKRYRDQFNEFIKVNAGVGLSLNGLNETMTLIGDVLFAFAILLAPLAIIQSVEAFQPFFVFIIGILLTLFLPKIFTEDISAEALIQKTAGVILVVIGSLWLHF